MYGDDGMTAVSRKIGIEKDKETDLLEYRGKAGTDPVQLRML